MAKSKIIHRHESADSSLRRNPTKPDTKLDAPSPRRRYSLKESCHQLSMSYRGLLYRIEDGEIPVVIDGGRIYILHDDLVSYAKRDHIKPIVPSRAA